MEGDKDDNDKAQQAMALVWVITISPIGCLQMYMVITVIIIVAVIL
jgi:hypothetical protein